MKVTLSGNLPDPDSDGTAPGVLDPTTGMYTDYWVLSKEDRSLGFVRPVRYSYIHESCGTVTRMGGALAETYARQPRFYGATFCVHCKAHFPVGIDGQFIWDDGSNSKVGS